MRSLPRILTLLALGALASGHSWAEGHAPHGRRGSSEPVPIPGGIVPFSGAPLLHVFAPGPSPPFMGLDIEPNVITNWNGFTAMGYLLGTATDRQGRSYDMQCDIRVYQGEYVSANGKRHHGTFGFI